MKKIEETVAIFEDEKEILIANLDNYKNENYQDINMSLNELLMSYNVSHEEITQLKQIGIIPKKQIIFKWWIPLSVFKSMVKENEDKSSENYKQLLRTKGE